MFSINYHGYQDDHFRATTEVADHDLMLPYYRLRVGADLTLFVTADQMRAIAEATTKALVETPLPARDGAPVEYQDGALKMEQQFGQ